MATELPRPSISLRYRSGRVTLCFLSNAADANVVCFVDPQYLDNLTQSINHSHVLVQ